MKVGDLTIHDIGRETRVEHEGWVHTGTLEKAEHEQSFRRVTTNVIVSYPSGARKYLFGLTADHPIELKDEA